MKSAAVALVLVSIAATAIAAGSKEGGREEAPDVAHRTYHESCGDVSADSQRVFDWMLASCDKMSEPLFATFANRDNILGAEVVEELAMVIVTQPQMALEGFVGPLTMEWHYQVGGDVLVALAYDGMLLMSAWVAQGAFGFALGQLPESTQGS